MALVVAANTRVPHQHIFELRYDHGHLFWDRCGRIVNETIVRDSGWEVENVQAAHCIVRDAERGLAFSFGPSKLGLTQSQDLKVSELLPLAQFGALAESMTQSVIEILALAEFPRIGFRALSLFPTTSKIEAYEALDRLKFVRIDDSFRSELGELSDQSMKLVVQRPSIMVRISISAFEQVVNLPPGIAEAVRVKAHAHSHKQRELLFEKVKAERMVETHPKFGILLDLDGWIEEPPYGKGVSASDFISKAHDEFTLITARVLEAV